MRSCWDRGLTGRKAIDEGQLVQPGQTMVDVVDGGDLWVIANYRETQLPGIRVGAPVRLEADAVPGVGDGAVADGFMRQMSEAGLKQMYGWALYASVALLLLLLLYAAPVRGGLKLMPLWTRLRREAVG